MDTPCSYVAKTYQVASSVPWVLNNAQSSWWSGTDVFLFLNQLVLGLDVGGRTHGTQAYCKFSVLFTHGLQDLKQGKKESFMSDLNDLDICVLTYCSFWQCKKKKKKKAQGCSVFVKIPFVSVFTPRGFAHSNGTSNTPERECGPYLTVQHILNTADLVVQNIYDTETKKYSKTASSKQLTRTQNLTVN